MERQVILNFILYICFMPKLLKIAAIFLLPVFVNSAAFLNSPLLAEIIGSSVEISINEYSSEGECNEQNEEPNEEGNDIDLVNLFTHRCYFKKKCCYNCYTNFHILDFAECYTPPPELIILV